MTAQITEEEITFWRAVVAADYALPPGSTLDTLLPRLLENLGSPNPVLRDELMYDIITEWMIRPGFFTTDHLRSIGQQTAAGLRYGLGETHTDSVFRRTFSALILTKVIELDSQRDFLPPQTVLEWFDASLNYFLAEQDFRGYTQEGGWAHAAAHCADLFMAFGLSPRLQAAHLQRLLDAIAARLTTQVEPVFLYMEDERLAYAAVCAIQRDLLSLEALAAWVERLAHPVGDQRWFSAENTLPHLSAYQNARLFLRSLYFQLKFGIRPQSWYADPTPFTRRHTEHAALLECVENGVRALDSAFYTRPAA